MVIISLYIIFLFGKISWERLEGMILLEELYYWGGFEILEVLRFI